MTLVPVDYSNGTELEAALKGHEVVISTFAEAGVVVQPGLAKAAKAAGIKLFVPSEYGFVRLIHGIENQGQVLKKHN